MGGLTRKKAKAEEKPKEPEVKWREGLPEAPGLYDCLVNGERKTLQLHRCIFSKRKYWMHLDGTDVESGAEIKWREGNVFL